LLEEVILPRTVLAVVCFISGIALLIPVSLWLWRFLVGRLASPPYLPDAHTDFVLFIGGRPIGSVPVLAMATFIGAALLLVGVRMVR
jgi:uncharacterized SAM-binding protein YcdF (DUF218 family)